MEDAYAIRVELVVVDNGDIEGLETPARSAQFTTIVPKSLLEEREWDMFLGDILLGVGRAVGFTPAQWDEFLKRIERRGY